MKASILSRLERLEGRVGPARCVGILELQPDGGWILTEDSKNATKYDSEEAGMAAFRAKYKGENFPLIIVDL